MKKLILVVAGVSVASTVLAADPKKIVCRNGPHEAVLEYRSPNDVYISEGDYPGIPDWDGNIHCSADDSKYRCEGHMVSTWGPWAGTNYFSMDRSVLDVGKGALTNLSVGREYVCP